MKVTLKTTISLLMALLCGPTGAATWYADAGQADDTGDGRTAATAKKYLQSAVALANADTDAEVTVLVLPGDYSAGTAVTDSKGAKNRVLITRPMTLASTLGSQGRDVTFIAGAFGSSSYGLGTDSIRAVCVESAAGGTVIQGFTFRDSAAGYSNGVPSGSGGGVCYLGDDCDVYVKDCTATNCAAYYGGGFRGVVAIRSLVTRCHLNNGNAGAALCDSKAYNCIFAHCGSSVSYNEHVLRGEGPYVNCTAVANNGSLLRYSTKQKIYNTLSSLCSRQEFDGTNKGGPNCIAEYGNGKDADGTQVAYSPNQSSAYLALLVSPYEGDYRPVANSTGGSAEGFGSTDWLTDEALSFVPAEDRGTDFFGNPRIVNGSVDCGAIQGAVEIFTSGGNRPRYVFRQTVPTTGSGTYMRLLYANPTRWPSQVYITPPDGTFVTVVSNASNRTYRFADAKGGFWQTFPKTGQMEVCDIAATAHLYVDAAAAAGGTGTQAAPFQTIQAAVDAASASGYTLIDVADGVYSNGTRVAEGAAGQAARVVIDGDKHVFIRAATNGGVVIQGEKDADELETENNGCGPGAVRCVVVSPGTAVIGMRGVVLRGGASGVSTLYTEAENLAGGLWVMGAEESSSRSYDVQVMDSTFAENLGRKGAAAHGGWLQRCRVFGNLNPRSGGISCLNRSVLSSCVVYDNRRRGDQLLANGTRIYFSSVYGMHAGDHQDLLSASAYAYGSVFICGKLNKVPAGFAENLVWELSTNAVSSGFTEADPLMANIYAGNFSPRTGSPALGRVDPSNINVDNLWRFHVGGFLGNRINMSAEGKITAGAIQDAYVPISAYADAAGGDDANDGLTAATAKRTLAAALQLASGYGDTVTAAAGTYASGTALQPSRMLAGTPTVPARAQVWPGVSLVGVGASNTVIRGGENVRGLVVGVGARVSGFMIADGQVATDSDAMTDDSVGGGVLAADDPGTTFTDCVFSNNAASFGGAARGGTYSRCVFVGNKSHYEGVSTSSGAAIINAATLRNCLFDGNMACRMAVDYDGIYNCTFLASNTRTDGRRVLSLGTYRGTAPLVNSAFIFAPADNSPSVQGAAIFSARNCFFPKLDGASWYWSIPEERSAGNITNDYVLAASSPLLTDAFALAKRNSIAVDKGETSLVADSLDLAGNPRVSNAIVDIGCYEWQWEPPNGTMMIFR